MGRIEFPSTPINAKVDTANPEQNGIHPEYVQESLNWLDNEQEPIVELGNCVVTSPVSFRKRVKGNQWQCSIHVEPDLLHPDQEGDYDAYAHHNHADAANSVRLRPGDRATMRGNFREEKTLLANGTEHVTIYFYVIEVGVNSRSPRKSITAYEQHNKGWYICGNTTMGNRLARDTIIDNGQPKCTKSDLSPPQPASQVRKKPAKR